jgi:transcription elongation factor SPT6
MLQKEKQRTGRRRAKDRYIQHPCYQNIDGKTAAKKLFEPLLEGLDVSDVDPIIRPSSRGLNSIVISFRIDSPVQSQAVLHQEVEERKKPNPEALGKELLIKLPGRDEKLKFEDLDEIVERYIRPVMANYNLILNYEKIRFGTKQEMENQLREDMEEEPNKIPYLLWQSNKSPARIHFLCLPGSKTVHSCDINVGPNGFWFEDKEYRKVSLLIRACKKSVAKMAKATRKRLPQRPLAPPGGWKSGDQAKAFFSVENQWFIGEVIEVLPNGRIRMTFPNYGEPEAPFDPSAVAPTTT